MAQKTLSAKIRLAELKQNHPFKQDRTSHISELGLCENFKRSATQEDEVSRSFTLQ